MAETDDWWGPLYDEDPKPVCAHERTIPVYAQPTNELVAQICQACDEQLPPPEPEDDPDRPRKFAPQPGYWPRPHMPASVTRTRNRAETAISPRTRRFLYNASAAGAGWTLGLYDQFAYAINDLGKDSISGALVLGFVGTALIAHVWDRRTRHWWPGIAWAARIPLATAILALALWAPAAP